MYGSREPAPRYIVTDYNHSRPKGHEELCADPVFPSSHLKSGGQIAKLARESDSGRPSGGYQATPNTD